MIHNIDGDDSYHSRGSLKECEINNPNDGKGWNFYKNPLVSKFNNDNNYNYIDYHDKEVMAQLENSLSIKAMFYHYIPIIPGFFEKLKGNY